MRRDSSVSSRQIVMRDVPHRSASSSRESPAFSRNSCSRKRKERAVIPTNYVSLEQRAIASPPTTRCPLRVYAQVVQGIQVPVRVNAGECVGARMLDDGRFSFMVYRYADGHWNVVHSRYSDAADFFGLIGFLLDAGVARPISVPGNS